MDLCTLTGLRRGRLCAPGEGAPAGAAGLPGRGVFPCCTPAAPTAPAPLTSRRGTPTPWAGRAARRPGRHWPSGKRLTPGAPSGAWTSWRGREGVRACRGEVVRLTGVAPAGDGPLALGHQPVDAREAQPLERASTSTERQAMTIVIRCGSLIDGSGRDPLHNATIVIEGDTITAVGRDAGVPAEAEVIDASHATVMPGLIDCHV